MAIPLTFLEATGSLRFAKTISDKGSQPYPNVKKLHSHSYYVEPSNAGLNEAYDLLTSHANQGHALLKGTVRKPLENESRRGQTDKFALTQTLVLDIDGFEMAEAITPPYSEETVRQTAEAVIAHLPEPFRNVSYIAHASSSTGLKADPKKANCHLIFFLKQQVGPEGLKEFLISLNLENEAFANQLRLTPQNVSIKYLIDPCLAHNTHILYIAPPTLQGIENPFPDDTHRWVLAEKDDATLDLIPMLADVCPQRNRQNIESALTRLRKDAGLRKHTNRYRTMRGQDGDRIQVLTNPDRLTMDVAYENDAFVYFNINNGDSDAYYCPKHNPDVIYNFKGEPPFEFSKANPELYEWYCNKYADVIKERSPVMPMVFRDFTSDKHYAVLLDNANDRIERIAEINKSNIDDWLADQGRSVPDPIPTWDYRFDPHNPQVYDAPGRFLNQFQLPDVLREPVELMPQYYVTLGEAKERLSELCPTIYKIIYHICGSADAEFEMFMNWLATSLQKRTKLTTAWVFSGVPGTGKGVFYEHILSPLIGENYTERKRIDHLEDKYNGYLSRCLFMVYDEFRLSDSKNDSKILNHLKDEIVAESGTIRDMYASPETHKLFTNYMFFSNHHDVIRIEEGDRRFNVAPPQRVRLRDAYPEIEKDISKGRIEGEIPQFGAFLMGFTINEHYARQCLENDAKHEMKRAALGWHEQFCLAVRKGDLDYFIDDLLEKDVHTDVGNVIKITSAQKIVRGWVRDTLAGEQSRVPVTHLHTVYQAMAPNDTTPKKFASILTRNDVHIERVRIDDQRYRAVITNFFSAAYESDALQPLLDEKPFQPDEPKAAATQH